MPSAIRVIPLRHDRRQQAATLTETLKCGKTIHKTGAVFRHEAARLFRVQIDRIGRIIGIRAEIGRGRQQQHLHLRGKGGFPLELRMP